MDRAKRSSSAERLLTPLSRIQIGGALSFSRGEVMKALDRTGLSAAVLAGLALAVATTLSAQSAGPAAGSPQANAPTAQTSAQAGSGTQSTPAAQPPAAQPAPGTTPVGGDSPAPAKQPNQGTATASTNDGQLPPCPAAAPAADDKKDKKKDKTRIPKTRIPRILRREPRRWAAIASHRPSQ